MQHVGFDFFVNIIELQGKCTMQKNYLRLYLRFSTIDGALDKLRICTVTGMTPTDKGQSTRTDIFCV
jgi:hypothetical protein